MNVKTVQCCQCGSPLRCIEAPACGNLIVCSYCSALLEVTPTSGHAISRLRVELPPASEPVQQIDLADEARQIADQITSLEQQWRLRWGKHSGVNADRVTRIQWIVVAIFLIAIGGSLVTAITSSVTALFLIFVAAIIGIPLCGFLNRYKSESREYDQKRTLLYMRLYAIYYVDE